VKCRTRKSFRRWPGVHGRPIRCKGDVLLPYR